MIPRFLSSGALSIAPYSKKLAIPFDAWRLVMAAVRVVCSRLSENIMYHPAASVLIPFHDQRDQLFLQPDIKPLDLMKSHHEQSIDTYRH